MKRPRSPTEPPEDPVLAQLDALINGAAEAPAEPPAPHVAVVDPVLAQLDALINGGTDAADAPVLVTPVALVLPQPPPPPALVQQAEEEPVPKGPPGLLREFGGVHGYMRMLSLGEP